MNIIIKSILIAQLVYIVIAITLIVILAYFYEHKFFTAWYDFWEGIYYDRHKRIIYVIPFPCFVYSFDRNKRKRKKKEKIENNKDENIQVENELFENIDCKY